MNTEPVAWMQSKTKELPDGCECMQSVSLFKANDTDIPLYTHPAKTLTDEEIIEVWDKMCSIVLDNDKNITEFARAILRKAQER